MPLTPTTGIQIDEVEAEITGAARDAERQLAQPKSSDPEAFVRQIREAMVRENWRTMRLSAD